MTYKQKYYLTKLIKIFLMYVVPILASLIIWGFLKEPDNNTLWGRIGLGSFIAFFMAIIFINDYIKKIFKNFELQDRNALLKNHAITFGLIGLLFSIAYFIAEDAILFCTVGFIAHTLALVFQLLERKYYKLWMG